MLFRHCPFFILGKGDEVREPHEQDNCSE